MESCSPTRRLTEGQYLLKSNEIKNIPPKVSKEELKSIIIQQPNRKILPFLRFHLQMYNLPSDRRLELSRARKDRNLDERNAKRVAKGKEPKSPKRTRWEWLREVVGEPPVILDSSLVHSSAEQLSIYLVKQGFFENDVQDSVIYNRRGKKRVRVEYRMSWKAPYTLDSVNLSTSDESLAHFIESNFKLNKLKVGERFNMDDLTAQRTELSAFLRNSGYYRFNKEYIQFEIDSTLADRKVLVNLIIDPPTEVSEGSPPGIHELYTLDRIIFNYTLDQSGVMDTLVIGDYTFVNTSLYPLKEKVLIQNTFVRKGDLFSQNRLDLTYRRLIALPIMEHARIRTVPKGGQKIDLLIELTPAKRQGVSVETQGTNSGGFLGIEGNIVYRHKNIFKGAETMEIKFNGGAQAQTLLTQDAQNIQYIQAGENITLNTVEFGPSVSLMFPKFLLPVSQERFARSSHPTTSINASFNFQQRPDFRRRLASMYFGYRWRESAEKNHQVNPLELSVIRIDKSASFQERLEEFNDQFLLDSYQDHFIMASSYQFVYDRLDKEGRKNDINYRARAEFGGNLLRLIYGRTNVIADSTGSYDIFGIRFAQYIKTSQDFRFYRKIDSRRALATRFAVGLGIPLENLNVLPFSKSFFGGGANGLRAWRARTLGPGGFFEPVVSYDKIGDVQIEADLEYRFNLISYLDGAIFFDAGNIWLLEPDNLRPKGDFQFDRFLGEMAIGGGIGLRIDFNYFLLRFDLAAQLKDPSLSVGERWIFQPKSIYNTRIDEYNEGLTDGQLLLRPYSLRLNFNLGIGYPF